MTQLLVPISRPTTSYGGPVQFRFDINSLPLEAHREQSPHRPGEPYADSDKLRALAVYAETGNVSEAARQTGLPRESIDDWVKAESSLSLIDELRSTVRYNEGWRLAKMVSLAMDKVERSLTMGDAVVLKNGQMVYKPISFKDSVVGMSILIDKWMLISGAISQSNSILQGISGLGQQLAEMGAALANRDHPPAEMGPLSPTGQGENLIG